VAAPQATAASAPTSVEEETEDEHQPTGRRKAVEIDLTSALGGLQSDSASGAEQPQPEPEPEKQLEQAFRELRSEAVRQAGPDQSAQHMTLARTYLEMGLPEQAVEPLKMASRATRFRFEAASMLGRIYRDREDVSQAIEWLERAAEAPAPSVDESRALLYDLGTLVEASGDTSRALAIFLELQSEADGYRDVDERVERLARVETGG
jgi:tetratricopeptide (TPR) repeat protein